MLSCQGSAPFVDGNVENEHIMRVGDLSYHCMLGFEGECVGCGSPNIAVSKREDIVFC